MSTHGHAEGDQAAKLCQAHDFCDPHRALNKGEERGVGSGGDAPARSNFAFLPWLLSCEVVGGFAVQCCAFGIKSGKQEELAEVGPG